MSIRAALRPARPCTPARTHGLNPPPPPSAAAARYTEDAISPCNVDPYAGPEDYPYEILSKIFDSEAQRMLIERAEIAKAQYAQDV